jgi:hypothetical protein
MTKFAKPSPAPEPELSPTRQRLAERLGELAEVEKAVAAELALAARLDDIHKAVGPAQSAISNHDAQNAAGFAAWARGDVTGKPTTDAGHRAELAAELANAEAASASATVAQEGFRHASIRAAAPLQRLKVEIASAAKLVMLEEAGPLLDQVRNAIAHAEDLHHQLLAATSVVRDGMESDISRAFGAFDDALRNAEAKPHDPGFNPHLSAWRKLELALTQNAAITLEDAAALDLPGAPVLPSFDSGAQMAAEVAAIMSFRTTSTMK